MYMHVLEIQMMSGGLTGCVGYILYSTVVVYMFKVLYVCSPVLLCSFLFYIE